MSHALTETLPVTKMFSGRARLRRLVATGQVKWRRRSTNWPTLHVNKRTVPDNGRHDMSHEAMD